MRAEGGEAMAREWQDTPNGSGLQAPSRLHQLPLLCSSEEQLPAGPADLISDTSLLRDRSYSACSPIPRGLLWLFFCFQISADQTRQVGDSIDWPALAGDWGHTLATEKEAGSDSGRDRTEWGLGVRGMDYLLNKILTFASFSAKKREVADETICL